MRVLLLFPSLDRGGTEEQGLDLGLWGLRAGHEPVLCFPRKETTASVVADAEAAGLRYVPWPLGGIVEGRNHYGSPAEQAAVLGDLLERERPNAAIVLVPWPDTSIGVLAACAAAGLPTVAIYCLVRDLVTIPEPARELCARMRSRAQQWVAISENNRAILAKLYGIGEHERIDVVFNGVDLPAEWRDPDPSAVAKVRVALREELAIPADARVALTVSRVSRGKGHQDLLEAIRRLPPSCADVHFVWAGHGELVDRMRAMAADFGVADRVHLLGYRRDVAALLHAADLFVFPSHGEGCARVLIEAMTSGLPVVCADASSNPELVVDGRYGLLYPEHDHDAFAQRLTHALDHPDLMRELAAQARQRARGSLTMATANGAAYALVDEVVAQPRPEPDPSFITALTALR
jgi:glycosyltransferase involved in cell wall biosynthesis